MRRFMLPSLAVAAIVSLASLVPAPAEENSAPSAEKPAAKKPAAEIPAPKEEPATKPAEKAKPAEEPKEKPAEKPKEEPKEEDPFKVPAGTPDELLKFIEGLQKMEPNGIRTQSQFTEFLSKRATATVEAAEKVLGAKPTAGQYETAAKAKLEALGVLEMLHSPTAETKLAEFIDELKKAGKTDLARAGRSMVLKGKARSLGNAAAAKRLLAEIKEFLSESPPTRADASLMMTVAQELEYGENPELAIEACKQFAEIAAKAKDPAVARLARRFEAVARRLGLLGNPIEIEGTTLDGKEFDWQKFRQGKVVLVDFWATWCGWCIREIPEVKKLYEAYHDRGFEVVGISGDKTRQPLDEFLKKNELPWTVLYGKDGPSPTIEHYGISAWPTVLLVDRDGKVVSLNARGKTLRDELKRLLGPIQEKPAEEKPAADKPKKDKPKANRDKPEPKE